MTKQHAIEQLFRDKECKDYCLKVSGNTYIADDLLQYSCEQLLMKPDEFIISKSKDNSLKRYFAGIVYKSFNYPSSPFYIEHIKFNYKSTTILYSITDQEFNDDDNFFLTSQKKDELNRQESILKDDKHIDILEIIDKGLLEKEILAYEIRSEKNWYEASILRLYIKYGNLRDLSKALKIPITSLSHSINNIKKYLNETICEKYY